MASSGSFLTNGWYSSSKGDYIHLEFAWSVSATSIENNNTTIYWELRGKRTASGYVNAGGFRVVIDGAVVYDKSTDYRIELRNGTVVASGTRTLSHDGTGKKSFSASAQGAIYTYAVNSTGSGSWELPTIPRQANLTSAPNFTDEQNPTINYSNPAGGAVTALEACISLTGAKDDIAYRAIPTGGSSYTFNLTEAERNVLRNATASSNSRTVQFFLRTTIGGTVFHSATTKTLSIVNANPTFPDSKVSYADVNQAVVNITGNNQHIVQGKSSLTATFGAATANKGASITGYTVSLNGVTKTASASGSVPFGAVNSSQDVTLSVTAKDSRGNTTTATKKVTVLAWSLPVISASLERLNNYEDETYLTVDASISSVNGKNTMAVSYKYKPSGGSYGSAVQIENKTRYTINCDKNNAYVFSITVADRFGSDTKEFHLDRGKFPLFIDTEMNAVGVNDFPAEGEGMRVAGGAGNFLDGIMIGGVLIADFPVEIGTSGIWSYKKWNSGEAELWGLVTLDTYGDSRHIKTSVAIPFRLTTDPLVTMTLYGAESSMVTQGDIVLSYRYSQAIYSTVLTLVMIKHSGGIVSGDMADVVVFVKGRWK